MQKILKIILIKCGKKNKNYARKIIEKYQILFLEEQKKI